MVKSKRKVDSHKVWLGIGISVAVLLLAVLLLYPFLTQPAGEKKAVAGKASSGTCSGGFEITSIKKVYNSVSESYDDTTDKDNIACCTGSSMCAKSGWPGGNDANDDYCAKKDDTSGKWYCGTNGDWYKCNENNEGKITSNNKFVCHDSKWYNCVSGDEEDENLWNNFGEVVGNFVCADNSLWVAVKKNKDSTNTELVKSDVYKKDNTGKNYISQLYYDDANPRVGYCPIKNQCITGGGNCKPYDEFYNNANMCGKYNDWMICDANADGVRSAGGKFICDWSSNIQKWVKCDSSKDTNSYKGYTCKGGVWLDDTYCGSGTSGQTCVVSDVLIKKKSNDGSYDYEAAQYAGADVSGWVGLANNPKGCILGAGLTGYGSLHNTYNDYVCGNNNDWLRCQESSENVVSDDGMYICGKYADVWKWKKISELSSSNTKGCSGIKEEEFCVASDMWAADTSGKWNVNFFTYAYESGRVGISTTKDSCVTGAGTAYPDDFLKDSDVNLCNKNKWFTCDSNAKGHTWDNHKFYCSASGWKACDTPGETVNDNFLCTDEKEWEECKGTITYDCPAGATDCKYGKQVGNDLFTCTNYKWSKKVAATEICTNSENWGKVECKDKVCSGSGDLFSDYVTWSYLLPAELSSLKANVVPESKACCGIGKCASGSTCYDLNTILSNSYLCGAYNDAGTDIYGSWYVCGVNTINAVSGDYTCTKEGTTYKWVEKTAALECTDSVNWNKKECWNYDGCALGYNVVWSYILPKETTGAYSNKAIPSENVGCCHSDQCYLSWSTGKCYSKSSIVNQAATQGGGSFFCDVDNNWKQCGGTGGWISGSTSDGSYTCDGTKWMKKEVTLGDANGNGCLDILEYNDLKDGFIHGTLSPMPIVTDYNDVKDNFIHGVGVC